MPLRQRLDSDLARLYADLARDLDAHSQPRAAHGAFTAFLKELGSGQYKRYAPFRGRSVQWYRLLRDARRAFGGRLRRLFEVYGSARTLWSVKLRAAGQLRVQRGRLVVTKGPGAGMDLAGFTSAEVDELLAHRPLRARHRAGGPATSGKVFELPADIEAMIRLILRRLKTLKPSRAVLVPRFVVKARDIDETIAAARRRALAALVKLEGLLDVLRDLVRELEGLVLVEDAPPVVLRGQGRGERPIAGIAIENAALTKRLADVGSTQPRLPAETRPAKQPGRRPRRRSGPRAGAASAEKGAKQGPHSRAGRRSPR